MKRTMLVALCVVVLASAASADFIKNGRFDDIAATTETTNIPNWTVTTTGAFVDQSGVFFVVDGITAQGSGMILLGTGSSLPNADRTTMTSDPFRVNQMRIEFQYVYATTQTAAEAAAGYTDPFSVVVTRTSDSVELYNQVIDSAANPDLVASNISYGVLLQKPGRPKLRQTEDWDWVVIDSSNWLGETVTITFVIADAIADEWNSGVFLDNVRNVPEPATIALFGLFGTGLGLAAWRRRRAKK